MFIWFRFALLHLKTNPNRALVWVLGFAHSCLGQKMKYSLSRSLCIESLRLEFLAMARWGLQLWTKFMQIPYHVINYLQAQQIGATKLSHRRRFHRKTSHASRTLLFWAR